MGRDAHLRLTINVVKLYEVSFEGMLRDAMEVLDDIEAGTVDQATLRERVEGIRTRFHTSAKADGAKMLMEQRIDR